MRQSIRTYTIYCCCTQLNLVHDGCRQYKQLHDGYIIYQMTVNFGYSADGQKPHQSLLAAGSSELLLGYIV